MKITKLASFMDIMSFNDKRERHGYWEVYYNDVGLSYKGNYINGDYIGYWEYYYSTGVIKEKTKTYYYIR